MLAWRVMKKMNRLVRMTATQPSCWLMLLRLECKISNRQASWTLTRQPSLPCNSATTQLPLPMSQRTNHLSSAYPRPWISSITPRVMESHMLLSLRTLTKIVHRRRRHQWLEAPRLLSTRSAGRASFSRGQLLEWLASVASSQWSKTTPHPAQMPNLSCQDRLSLGLMTHSHRSHPCSISCLRPQLAWIDSTLSPNCSCFSKQRRQTVHWSKCPKSHRSVVSMHPVAPPKNLLRAPKRAPSVVQSSSMQMEDSASTTRTCQT